MKKLGLVITDGVGFRNFILSDFILKASKAFDEVVVYSFLPAEAYKDHSGFNIIELEALPEQFVTWFFRKTKEIAHLRNHAQGNAGIGDNLKTNYARGWTSRGIATRLIYMVTLLFHGEWFINLMEWCQFLTIKNHRITKDHDQLVQQHGVAVLFFTHQRPPFLTTLVIAARRQNIKTAAFIFSWDNLASKGRMAAQFDAYLVWSDLMKNELLEFYPRVPPDQISIVGTPQFAPYADLTYTMKRDAFFETFPLNPTHKTLFFSCGDVSTSANDPTYIRYIAEAISANCFGPVNFLVRTSPAESPERFKALCDDFPWIEWNTPDWPLMRQNHQESWSQRVPTARDIKELRAILTYTDVNINMLSTMSLDAMLFDKPVINTVMGNQQNGWYDDQRFFDYRHIDCLLKSKSTHLAKDREGLITAIREALNQPQQYKTQREAFIKQQIGRPLGESTAHVIASLIGLNS